MPGTSAVNVGVVPKKLIVVDKLTAASKAFNLAGLKMAVAHTTCRDISDRFAELPGHLFGGINTIGMRATLACWNTGDEWQQAVLKQLTANRDLMHDLLAEHLPQVTFRKPEATYLGWIDCNGLDLGGALLGCVLMALTMANAGGAWDNAKK